MSIKVKRDRKKGYRRERLMAPEQEPDVELKFPVSVFSMPNTSWITHHYPTGLALRAALSLSPSLALRLSLSL